MTQTRHFDKDLEALKAKVLHMGSLAERMIHHAVKMLIDRDAALLDKVKQDEDQVNKLHIEIDQISVELIALHQPTARDLRMLMAVVKINSDLERIADQAVNIVETGSFLCKLPVMKMGDIPRMAELATSMLKDSLDAFTGGNVDLARSVIRRDEEEDQLKSETFNELLQMMQSDASKIERAIDMILISRNLERIADHATNIAEDVIFMVLSKDIRHPQLAPAP